MSVKPGERIGRLWGAFWEGLTTHRLQVTMNWLFLAAFVGTVVFAVERAWVPAGMHALAGAACVWGTLHLQGNPPPEPGRDE